MEETYQDVVAVRNFGLYNFKLFGITEQPSPRLLESVRREIVVKVIHQDFMRSSFDWSWTFKSDYVHGMTIELSKTEDFNSKYDYFQTPIDKPSDYFIRNLRYFIYYPILCLSLFLLYNNRIKFINFCKFIFIYNQK